MGNGKSIELNNLHYDSRLRAPSTTGLGRRNSDPENRDIMKTIADMPKSNSLPNGVSKLNNGNLRTIMKEGPVFSNDRQNKLSLNVKAHQNRAPPLANGGFQYRGSSNKENRPRSYNSWDKSFYQARLMHSKSRSRSGSFSNSDITQNRRFKYRAPPPPSRLPPHLRASLSRQTSLTNSYTSYPGSVPTGGIRRYRKKHHAPEPPKPRVHFSDNVQFRSSSPVFKKEGGETEPLNSGMPPIPPRDYDVDDVEFAKARKSATLPNGHIPQSTTTPLRPPRGAKARTKHHASRRQPNINDLHQELVKAAQQRESQGVEVFANIGRPKSFHQAFADELQSVVSERERRRSKGTLKLRNFSRPAIQQFETRGKKITFGDDSDIPSDRTESDSLKSSDHHSDNWIPQHDLIKEDDVGDEPLVEELTARGADIPNSFFTFNKNDISKDRHQNGHQNGPIPGKYAKNEEVHQNGPMQGKYAKNEEASKPGNKRPSIKRFKQSMKTALGSLGRNFHKKKQLMNGMFDGSWEIYPAEDYDTPPEGPISVHHIEKRPVYAYNAETEQLVVLPDYDRVIVTSDGLRIREESLTKIHKVNKPDVTPVESVGLLSHSQEGMSEWEMKVQEERSMQLSAEMQFAQVRKMSRHIGPIDNLHPSRQQPQSVPPPPAGHPDSKQSTVSDQADLDLPQKPPRRKRSKVRKSKTASDPSLHRSNPIYTSDSDADTETSSAELTKKQEGMEDSGFGTDNSGQLPSSGVQNLRNDVHPAPILKLSIPKPDQLQYHSVTYRGAVPISAFGSSPAVTSTQGSFLATPISVLGNSHPLSNGETLNGKTAGSFNSNYPNSPHPSAMYGSTLTVSHRPVSLREDSQGYSQTLPQSNGSLTTTATRSHTSGGTVPPPPPPPPLPSHMNGGTVPPPPPPPPLPVGGDVMNLANHKEVTLGPVGYRPVNLNSGIQKATTLPSNNLASSTTEMHNPVTVLNAPTSKMNGHVVMNGHAQMNGHVPGHDHIVRIPESKPAEALADVRL